MGGIICLLFTKQKREQLPFYDDNMVTFNVWQSENPIKSYRTIQYKTNNDTIIINNYGHTGEVCFSTHGRNEIRFDYPKGWHNTRIPFWW